jgi:hypothetical protein
MAILWSFRIFLPILCQEQSGNPGCVATRRQLGLLHVLFFIIIACYKFLRDICVQHKKRARTSFRVSQTNSSPSAIFVNLSFERIALLADPANVHERCDVEKKSKEQGDQMDRLFTLGNFVFENISKSPYFIRLFSLQKKLCIKFDSAMYSLGDFAHTYVQHLVTLPRNSDEQLICADGFVSTNAFFKHPVGWLIGSGSTSIQVQGMIRAAFEHYRFARESRGQSYTHIYDCEVQRQWCSKLDCRTVVIVGLVPAALRTTTPALKTDNTTQ